MIARLRLLPPAAKGLVFALIPLAYYFAGKLNYSQAGLAAVLGFFTLTTLFYWREIRHDRRPLFHWLVLIALGLIVMNIGFQATVRDIFGLAQEDVIVVQAIFSTDTHEAAEFFVQYGRYIGMHVAAFLVCFLSYWFLCVRDSASRPAPVAPSRRVMWTAGSLTFVLVAMHFNPTIRKSDPLFYFPINYNKWQLELAEAKQVQENLALSRHDANLNSMKVAQNVDRRTVVFVIGESDTRNNWSLYGYQRKTTPELDKLRDQLVVFNNGISGDCSTIGSITKMLTPATMEAEDLWKSKPSIVPMAQAAGYKVFWVTNQGTEGRGIVSILASQADVKVFTNKGGSRLEGTLDEAVLEPFKNVLNDPAEKKLIILHVLGEHPSYNYRYPKQFGVFEGVFDDPVAKGLIAQGRTPWGLSFRNFYDSAEYYHDYVLSQSLKALMAHKETPSAWLYISDHGQDVAHNNDFSGHHIQVKEMWEVPMVFWRSPDFDLRGVDPKALASRPYQADVIDHSILGLMGVSGNYYDPRLDIFSTQFDPGLQLPRNFRGLIKYPKG